MELDGVARDGGSGRSRPRPIPGDVLDRIAEWCDERFSCAPNPLRDEVEAYRGGPRPGEEVAAAHAIAALYLTIVRDHDPLTPAEVSDLLCCLHDRGYGERTRHPN
jgi:hypothetical protein